MAKGTGLIGNFKGKFGNAVGYSLKDSNNKQTQGIRVYQPVVRNPKTYAQATQRCIMKPINDFYRLMKPIIGRGFQGVTYGNASRLAWLKRVMKNFQGPWLVKNSSEQWPIACLVTSGELGTVGAYVTANGALELGTNADITKAPATDGALYTAFKKIFPALKSGDQITFVSGIAADGTQRVNIVSVTPIVNGTTAVTGFSVSDGTLLFTDAALGATANFGCAIVSREGDNGSNLRSEEYIHFAPALENDHTHYGGNAEEAAIRSYMTNGGNVDWPEDNLDA